MIHDDIVPAGRQLDSGPQGLVPAFFLDAGEQSWRRFVEFFTAYIRCRNTRLAYGRAVRRFATWCEGQKVRLDQLSPFIVAAYIEQLGTEVSVPTTKQHLAAIRMLLDYLVTGQVVPMNPAAAVRGPRYSVKKGKTLVLDADQARVLLDSIATQSISGLRDRALIGAMLFSFARISAVINMAVEDFYSDGRRWWLRLHEKGGKLHEVPVHHKLDEYMDEYLAAAGIGNDAKAPLFRSLNRRRLLTAKRISRREALAMVKRRARDAGLPPGVCCHSFRATGITAYLNNGGTLENDRPYYLLGWNLFGLVAT